MEEQAVTVHLVYFSPNGTTRRTVKRIAQRFAECEIVEHNLLSPESRRHSLAFSADDLVILGLPTAGVLYGRIHEVFECLHGSNTPMIGVVLYGNGYYGVALKQMQTIADEHGFRMTAMGAFIGQHALNGAVATGRPDEQDMKVVDGFANSVYEKVIVRGDYRLHSKPGVGRARAFPYNLVVAARNLYPTEYWLPAFLKSKQINENCNDCGSCARNCPTGAINLEERGFDLSRCIGCHSCVNRCPKGAIESTSVVMKMIMKDFGRAAAGRMEPELFI
jgi:ferredoxin/flavodoxin